MLVIWIGIFSILGSIGAVLAAAAFLLVPKKVQRSLIPGLLSYATGTLLAAALLGLIPHAFTYLTPQQVLSTVLGGIILFFLFEKFVVWRHCHDMECEAHGSAGPILLIGDAFHNATDGMVIAASFLGSISMGIIASLSIIIHEVAQEVGDFAVLLHSGYSKRKAFSLNTLSGLSTVPAAILAYYTLEMIQATIPYVMALSAASFIYIALVDLAPELHRKVGLGHTIGQLILLLVGIGTITLFLHHNS